MPSDILAQIVQTKWEEIAAFRSVAEQAGWASQAHALAAQERAATDASRSSWRLEQALAAPGRIRIIAEIKKASPSAGLIRADFDPQQLAASYMSHGADALSILTDVTYFQGSLDDLRQVAQQNPAVPILRKDFLLDEIQLYEAKLAGAAAVLFIAECLPADRLQELVALAHELNLSTLVELYDPELLPGVIACGTRLIGVNNRDLRTFTVDLQRTLDLLPLLPSDRLLVSESGIRSGLDLQRLQAAGVHAVLVGEAFMRTADPGATLANWLQIASASEHNGH